mgnify:CR=1 FL=1
MTGVWWLTRLHVRTSWAMLLGPSLALAALVIATASGVKVLYAGAEQKAVYAATMGASPAGWAFNGRGVDLTTIGGIAAYEVGFMGQLLIPVIGLLLGIGLTRRLEEAGVIELVTAGRVARTAVPIAALVVGTGSWLVFAMACDAGLSALGFDRSGAGAYPAILALYGMAFTGIGLLAGQLAQGTRGAYVLGAVVILAAFVGRVYVDGRQLRQTWVSPMGWIAEAHPWGTWVWWPAWAFLGLEAVAVVAALLIAARRDLGSGVLPQRLGPGRASTLLATPVGLAWRLTRGTTFGWTSGAVIWCASLGLMADEMARIIRANPTLAEALGDDPGQVVSVMSLVITGIVAGATGIAASSRFGAEEQSARIGLALAGAVSRVRLWLVWTGVAVASALATLFAGALALGLAQWVSGGARSTVGRELRAAGAYTAPVVLVTVSAGLLVALSPRLRGLAWLPLGWFAVVGLMAEALRLPRWSRDLSPYELVGRVPLESLDRTAWGWLAISAVAALSLATVRFSSRSLIRG